MRLSMFASYFPSVRSIERRSEFIELGQPPDRLFLQVIVDEAAGRPPQADVNDQINRYRTQDQQSDQPADEGAFSDSRNKALPYGCA